MQPVTGDTASTSGTAADSQSALDAISARLQELASHADPSDLKGLADIHGALQQAADLAESTLDQGRAAALQAAATACMQLLEQIVLQEVDDVRASLQQVARTIVELQSIIAGQTQIYSPDPCGASPVPAAVPSPAPQVPDQAPLSEGDLPLVQEFIGEATGHIEAAEAGLLQLEEDPANPDALNAVFRAFHTIKGVAGFLNLTQIQSLAHAAENLLDLARKANLQFDSAVADVILHSIDAMRKLVELLGPVVAARGGVPAQLEGLDNLLSQLHACARGDRRTDPGAAPPQQAPQAAPAAAARNETRTTQGGGDATIKVSTDRLDSLINMVGELVIAQAMVSQDMTQLAAQDRRVARNISHLGKITRELQDLSMSMRMVPIQGVFQKMARLVRDLARKAGKEIEFVVVGGETELDRNAVEAISDPLVHMVRNAADHGIEPPDERIKVGKRSAGTLTLKAYHLAGNIVIEIIDDGRGLNKRKILRKAVDNGLVREGDELSDREIFNLIFAAGLSTAEKVTDVSGRGVGMDVVRRNVEALRGQIDITSTEGKGSTFTIRLPLTLAVIDGLVVKVGAERYIIPITSIEQSLRPRAEHISTVLNRGEMCMVRQQLLPVVRLHRLFNVAGAKDELTGGLLVIVQDGTHRCCLLVDDLLGQQQVVIKSLGASLGQIKGVSGGAILGDGNVSLILDVPGLIAATSTS